MNLLKFPENRILRFLQEGSDPGSGGGSGDSNPDGGEGSGEGNPGSGEGSGGENPGGGEGSGGDNPDSGEGSGGDNPGSGGGDKRGERNGHTEGGYYFDFDSKNTTMPKDQIRDNRDSIMEYIEIVKLN